MAAPFATVIDVATRLGLDFASGAETEQVEAFLRDVSAIIRSDVPDIDARIGAGTLDVDLVVAVMCQVTARVLTSAGSGIGVESETHPEYAYRLTKAAAEGLELTDGELRRLMLRRGTAFSITPG